MPAQIPSCYDPVYQAERQQLAYTAKMMKRPICECCGERIWTEEYLDLEPFGINGHACERCVNLHKHYTENLEESF